MNFDNISNSEIINTIKFLEEVQHDESEILNSEKSPLKVAEFEQSARQLNQIFDHKSSTTPKDDYNSLYQPIMKSMGSTSHQPVFDKSIDWKAPVNRVDQKKKIVHMICHSHQDAGWIKTPDQYYDDQVKHIYTHVVGALETNPKRTFNHAEIWFFQRWWKSQDEDMKKRFRKLLAEGRWVFNNGGWIASDEATPLYEDIVENIKVGHDFL